MPLASREYLETKCFHPSLGEQLHARRWHAVFTHPQNEKSVVKHLEIREIESFLPPYETVRLWKNRQRKTIVFAAVPHIVRPYQFTGTYKSAAVSQSAGDRGKEPRTEPNPRRSNRVSSL
jgi:hypothetical protein